MNEFVKVIFPSRRSVLVDGAPSGLTNETFVVQRGFHEFALEPPPDFSPASQEHSVLGTTRPNPFLMAFQEALADEMAGARRTARRRAAKRRAAKRRPAAKRAAKKRTALGRRRSASRSGQAKKARRTRKR